MWEWQSLSTLISLADSRMRRAPDARRRRRGGEGKNNKLPLLRLPPLLLRRRGRVAEKKTSTAESTTWEKIAVSCMASGEGLEDDRCENTTYAAMFLSCYLVIITMVAIGSRTVPQEERGEGMTYSNLAILRLKMKEKVQGSLGVVTALVSMYLFSVLGVEGAPNETIIWVGLACGVTMLIAALIEFASIVFGRSVSPSDGQAGSISGSLGEPSNIGAEQRLSLSNIEENMTVAGLV